MATLRAVFELNEHSENLVIRSALKLVSWEFRGIINQQSGDLLLMCECISLNSPPPPPGFSINGISVESHLDSWVNNSLVHTTLVLRFDNSIGRFFMLDDLTILAGTNLTSKGLVVQLSGKKSSMISLLQEIKKYLKVKSVSTARGGKGIVSGIISSDEYEILKTAHSQGWYNSPKSTNLRKLAKDLKISKSSVANHIKSSESKIIGDFFNQTK